jgi:rhodanese-related sulfurtransferase
MSGTTPRQVQLDDRGLPTGYTLRPEWEVTPRQVKAMLDAGDDLVILDVRTPREFEVARIDAGGVELAPLQTLTQRVDDLEELRDRRIVTLCHHGVRSMQAAAVLRQAGFRDVLSIAGGIDVWSLDVDPSVPRY